MKNLWTTAIASLAFVALAAAPAVAAKNPYTRANNSLITIDGKVSSVSADAFMLDYGDGLVKVEMDDGDRDADGYKLLKGDNVRVTGFIDDDLFETTTIEAGSVYVENLGTYFFASAADEEDYYVPVTAPLVVSATFVQGKVTDVTGRKFTVDTGTRKFTVDTASMGYNPLDDEGYQKIDKGDRVSVGGKMDRTFWGKRQLKANSVLTLADQQKGSASAGKNKNKAKSSDTASAAGKAKANTATK